MKYPSKIAALILSALLSYAPALANEVITTQPIQQGQLVYPADMNDWSEAARNETGLLSTAIAGAQNLRPATNPLTIALSGSAMTLSLGGGGQAVIAKDSASGGSGNARFIDSCPAQTYTIPANSSGSTRVDEVVLQYVQAQTNPHSVQFNNNTTSTVYNATESCQFGYYAGTTTPPAGYLGFANISVPNGATTASQATITYLFPTMQSQITTMLGGVLNSVNSLTGAVTIAAGTNMSLTPSGNTLTLGTVNNPTFSGTLTAGAIVGDIVNKVYNVKTYGATGNGATDDTTAIQNALNQVIQTGGIVYFPPGQYRTSNALTIDLTVSGGAGGVVVMGSGRGRRGSYLGSIIEPTSRTADVFVVKQASSNGQGGVHFHDFGIDHSILASNPTAGNDFNLSSASPSTTGAIVDVEISSVNSFQPYNFVQVGWTGVGGIDGGTNIHDFNAESTQNACLKVIGSTGSAGGLTMHHGYCAGINGASICIQIQGLPSGSNIDPMNVDTIDCESYGIGFIQDSGAISDSTFNNIILDGVATGPAFVVKQGAKFQNIRIYDSWFTTAAQSALVLSGNGATGNISGVIVEGSYLQAGTGDSIFVGDGSQYVDFIGDHGGFSTGCGLLIGGGSTTRNINVTGGGYDNLYNVGGSANNKGICIVPGSGGTVDHVAITGTDLTGNTSNALSINYTNAVTNITVTGNDMTGYTTPVLIAGTETASTKFASNNGYGVETSTQGGGLIGWEYNRLAGNPTDILAQWEVGGVSKASVTGSGNFTMGTLSATTGTFSGAISATNGTFSNAVYAGSGNGLSLTAGDLGASRSTTTGALTLGGSGASCTTDYNVTTGSTLTVSCAEKVTGGILSTTGGFTGAVTSPTIATLFQESSALTSSPHFEAHAGTTIAGNTVTYTFHTAFAAAPICTATVTSGNASHTLAIGAVTTTAAQVTDGATESYSLICVGQ